MPKVDWKNIGERAGWTGAQAVLGYAVTLLAGIPAWWAAPVALALSVAKNYVMERLTKAGVNG